MHPLDPMITDCIKNGIDTVPAIVDVLFPGTPDYRRDYQRGRILRRLSNMEKYGQAEKVGTVRLDNGQSATQWRIL